MSKRAAPIGDVAATTRVQAPASHRLAVLGAMLAWIALANQGIALWLGARLGYPGYHAPWAWLRWQAFYGYAPTAFNMAYLFLMVATVGGITVAVLYLGRKNRSLETSGTIHGTAHWASKPEIEAGGLLQKDGAGAGVFVGGWTEPKTGHLHYLRHDGPEHIAGIAPTRSGKGVGLVVPTALTWPASMIVNDMKGELWNLTAGWRKEQAGNIVLKFDPAAPEGSIAFNPLDEIRFGTLYEVGDAQNLSTIIVDPDGKGLVDHWAKTSHALLVGVILHQMYKARGEGRTTSLYDIAFALSDPERPIGQLWDEMIENKHDEAGMYGTTKVHPAIAGAGRDMKNKPANEAGSVISTAQSFLSLYRDPIVRKNTARSDFHITDLMNSEKPVSLYIIVNADNKDRMKPLMRLILNQIVRVLLRPDITYKNGRGVMPHKHRLLLLLDEFPSYGKLDVFEEALAYIAGYGIKAYLIMQDIEQLKKAYGPNETITSNCHVRSVYAPNKIETGEWMSKMSGVKTETKIQTTVSGKRFGAIADHFSQIANETQRPLLTADEAMRLKGPEKSGDDITAPGDVVVFVAGHTPIMGTQSLFFRDPRLLQRSQMAPPARSDKLDGAPIGSEGIQPAEKKSASDAYQAQLEHERKKRSIDEHAASIETEMRR